MSESPFRSWSMMRTRWSEPCRRFAASGAMVVDPGPVSGSEDVGMISDALGVPIVYWLLGGLDPAEFVGASSVDEIKARIADLPGESFTGVCSRDRADSDQRCRGPGCGCPGVARWVARVIGSSGPPECGGMRLLCAAWILIAQERGVFLRYSDTNTPRCSSVATIWRRPDPNPG